MTSMNTEPAAGSPSRLWPNARGAASRNLLRAGIASAPASLFLVLICGLAYADASASLSVNVVPSGSPPNATCHLGNHGPVRGWAHILNGTLVADDNCILQVGTPNDPLPVQYLTLSQFQNVHDNGHYNTIRYSIYTGQWYDEASAGQTITDIENQLDTAVSLANQTGLYILVDNHNAIKDPTGGLQGCPDWTTNNTIWNAIASRYANDTNVIYQLQNEPDNCSSENYADIATQMDSLYKLVRAAAPNTPIFVWTFENPTFVSNGPGLLNELAAAPDISYANAVVDFHNYSAPADTQTFINTARGAGFPTASSEYGICTGSTWNQLLSIFQSLGNSWSCGDGYPDNNPGFVVTWPKD